MKVELLGIDIDNVSYEEAVERVRSWWKEGGRHIVVTPNPEMVMYAARHADHRRILNEADMAVADGAGIVWASAILGKKLQGRVTGTDLAEKLVAEASRLGETVFFLGGRYGAAERSAEHFGRRFPSLKVAGWAEGDGSEKGDLQTRKMLMGKQIGLLLVAYGHPKQEYWMKRNLSVLDVKVAMGVGGAFNFWSGRSRRAPEWMRRWGLEWLYRLMREPWRIKRQLVLPLFVIKVLSKRINAG